MTLPRQQSPLGLVPPRPPKRPGVPGCHLKPKATSCPFTRPVAALPLAGVGGGTHPPVFTPSPLPIASPNRLQASAPPLPHRGLPFYPNLSDPGLSWPRKPPLAPKDLGLAPRGSGPAKAGGPDSLAASPQGVALIHKTLLGWAGRRHPHYPHTVTSTPPPPRAPGGGCNVVIATMLIASKWSLQPFD